MPYFELFGAGPVKKYCQSVSQSVSQGRNQSFKRPFRFSDLRLQIWAIEGILIHSLSCSSWLASIWSYPNVTHNVGPHIIWWMDLQVQRLHQRNCNLSQIQMSSLSDSICKLIYFPNNTRSVRPWWGGRTFLIRRLKIPNPKSLKVIPVQPAGCMRCCGRQDRCDETVQGLGSLWCHSLWFDWCTTPSSPI